MNPDKRGESETYEDYKARRKRNKLRLEHYLRGQLIWDSRQRGQAVRKVKKGT